MSPNPSKPKVFLDTNALLSMIIFPIDAKGDLSLAGEVLELYDGGEFDLLISEITVAELRDVISEDFPEESQLVDVFMKRFENLLAPAPNRKEIDKALPYAVDSADAPIMAAAVLSKPDIVVSNDFKSFHAEKAKPYWIQHKIEVLSLFGLLKKLGKR